MSRRRGLRLAAVGVALCVLAAGCNPFTAPDTHTVDAIFSRSNNLFEGSEVRVLGLAVGRVINLEPEGPNVRATLEIAGDVQVPADARAVLSPTSLLGERFVQLEPPYLGGPTMDDGAVIPLERTSVPAEVDEVLASFERFLEGLDPETIAELVDVLAETLAGQGEGLNQLIGQGSTTLRVLADGSDDLTAIVSELGRLNAALATRDEQIGQALEDWSVVVRTVAEENDEIIEGIDNLRRLTQELRPLTEEHADALVLDLEILATSLSTVERNLDRLGTMMLGSRQLFEGAGRAVDFPGARLRLDNESEELGEAIQDRLTDRLVGVCLRLELPECAVPGFWEAHLPALLCYDGLVACTPDRTTLAQALADALGLLPPEAAAEALAPPEPDSHDDPATDAGHEPGGGVDGTDEDTDEDPLDRLPLPDPQLEQEAPLETNGFLDALARLFGGGR